MHNLFYKLKRVMKKPPRFIFERVIYEIKAEFGRFWEPYLPSFLTTSSLLKKLKSDSLEDLWNKLALKPFCTECLFIEPSKYEEIIGNTHTGLINLAEAALENKVDLLGSGPIFLGSSIDWNKDYKSSYTWKRQYFKSISYSDLEKQNDVKFPWELSRMQWMIPLGQAYLLTKDEKYAQKVKTLLLSWIESNPYTYSVNWVCTMDVALRAIVWTWFFHVLKDSPSWNDPHFRWEFLKILYLHGIFISRHLEKSDVNGNHYTADAAGLVFIGLFFEKNSWHQQGWLILEEEIKLQVFEDGVDFEASIPYHRLVLELFFFPAQYRLKHGLDVSPFYEERLCKMAYFTAHYSRLDGSIPLWGDGDDARVLPFGDQALNDHRYLIGLVGTIFPSHNLLSFWSGSNVEQFWIFGETPPCQERSLVSLSSQSFPEGGFYIMRDDRNHVFIDCGPLGLKGRGGHGHNDILSFEATLDHAPLITDCGAFVYTANYIQRNLFRSTSYHNTPQVDGEEINRFIRPDYLWTLHHDALPSVESWVATQEYDLFRGSHSGYERLKDPLRPTRTIKLDHHTSELTIEDLFEGKGQHKLSIPFHLHPSVTPKTRDNSSFFLVNGKDTFIFQWESESQWQPLLEPSRYSPRYGIVEDSHKIVFQYDGTMNVSLKVTISPLKDTQ